MPVPQTSYQYVVGHSNQTGEDGCLLDVNKLVQNQVHQLHILTG